MFKTFVSLLFGHFSYMFWWSHPFRLFAM